MTEASVTIEDQPLGGLALGATTSGRPGSLAVTLINRDYRRPVDVAIVAAGMVSSSRVLMADRPNAVNDPRNPERVSPRPLTARQSGADRCTVTMPPHSMATIELVTRSGVN